MPGMLTAEQVASLREASGPDFDPLFVRLMTFHHEGAIAMAQEAMDRAGDPRLHVTAQAIWHEQRGEIALVRGAVGLDIVRDPVSDLVAPAGSAEGTGASPR
jgi:uncharacterized protein (DUF305 family)